MPWELTRLYSVLSPQLDRRPSCREYENSLKETRMAEMLKQEERAIQERYEECHHQLGRRNSAVGTQPSRGGYQEIHGVH